ncbi:hypothetical protein BD626DRAFT_505882 [Schizophyllum amplum]|uniref:Uncharacterized protein n=1 Tax=Schizophyllum amplum TaxID=97359 RepID=A0A550C610_9AGAR|nr:hypothetical protein BD626DRAFT_505882 [Auriculariopsis ampla]
MLAGCSRAVSSANSRLDPLQSVFRAAAGRAWHRTAVAAHDHAKPDPTQPIRLRGRMSRKLPEYILARRKGQPYDVSPPAPQGERVTESNIITTPTTNKPDTQTRRRRSTDRTLPSAPGPTLPPLPSPTSRKTFLENIYTLCARGTPLPTLLDYHAASPFQSRASLHALLQKAVRERAFGSVAWIARAMRSAGMHVDPRLAVRALVKSGYWERAWTLAQTHAGRPPTSDALARAEVPLEIWREFTRALHVASLRLRIRRRLRDRKMEGSPPLPVRQWLEHVPAYIPENLAQLHPVDAYGLIRALILADRRRFGVQLAMAYFKSLGPDLPPSRVRHCLDIVNLIVAFAYPLRGLRQFHQANTAAQLLVSLHPSFRPTPSTLFLLLRPLKHAKRCGTIAVSALQFYTRRWGECVVNARVRRRAINLCIKEKRWDLVRALLAHQRARGLSDEEILGRTLAEHRRGRRRGPAPARKAFETGAGRERRLWRRLHGVGRVVGFRGRKWLAARRGR